MIGTLHAPHDGGFVVCGRRRAIGHGGASTQGTGQCRRSEMRRIFQHHCAGVRCEGEQRSTIQRMRRRFTLAWFLVLASAACSGTTAVSQTPPADCAVVSTFADDKSPRLTRHVAIDGNDTTGDGSTARPFRTLTRAAGSLLPGTAIYLHPGTY